MQVMSKNPNAVALGRLGGKAKSPRKTVANRRNAAVSAWLRKQQKQAEEELGYRQSRVVNGRYQ